MVLSRGRGTQRPAQISLFQLLSAEDAHLGSVGVVFGRAEGREDKRFKASHFSARLYCRV